MHIKNKFDIVNKEFQDVLKKYSELKPDYHRYISDTSINLFERWEFFKSVPSVVREQEKYCISVNTPFLDAVLSNDGIREYRRCEVINFIALFDTIIDKQNNISLDDYEISTRFNQHDVKDSMEEILLLNIESCVFDW